MLGGARQPTHSTALPVPGRVPAFCPRPHAWLLLCGSCPMEGEEAVARLVDHPPNSRVTQEPPKEGENGAGGAAAAEELTGSEDAGDSGVPTGHLRPDRDTPRSEHGDGERWG